MKMSTKLFEISSILITTPIILIAFTSEKLPNLHNRSNLTTFPIKFVMKFHAELPLIIRVLKRSNVLIRKLFPRENFYQFPSQPSVRSIRRARSDNNKFLPHRKKTPNRESESFFGISKSALGRF
jgi:hypothetical protein